MRETAVLSNKINNIQVNIYDLDDTDLFSV